MASICIYVDDCGGVRFALKRIADDFPCWISTDKPDDVTLYIAVRCRTADAARIEHRLAPYV